jgi:hypothetical protein
MGLFSSLKAARKLMKISKILGDQKPITADGVLSFSKISIKKKQAEEELYDLVFSLPKLQVVLNQYGIDREKLRDVYDHLRAIGCGQWIFGYYVATAALAYRETLEACLQHFESKTMNIQL